MAATLLTLAADVALALSGAGGGGYTVYQVQLSRREASV